MAVDPDRIEEIIRASIGLYRAAEQAILQLVTKALDQGWERPSWADERLAAITRLRRAAEAILRRLATDASGAIAEAVAAGYRTGSGAALAGVPAPLAATLAGQTAPAAAAVAGGAAVEALAAAVIQDVGERHSNVLRHVEDVYRQVIAEASAVTTVAGRTRREASQHAYARLVDEGITSFTDSAGRRWRLSSYVEMAVRTVTQRAAVQGQTDRLHRLGQDFVTVSDEAQECVRCRPFEGKILRLGPGTVGDIEVRHAITGQPTRIHVTTTLEAARAAGLQHPNCRHVIRIYLPGVTKRPAGPTADPEGDRARQRQRAIERHIRRWKERETAALTPEARRAARVKVRAWQTAMRGHLAAHPALKRLPYREQPGAGNVPRP